MGRMRFGVHKSLEDEADLLLKRSLAGVTTCSAKSDILTPSKEIHRRRREVFVPSGTPDPANRRGLYGRSPNSVQTHLNSRDGVSPPSRQPRSESISGLAAFVQDHLA